MKTIIVDDDECSLEILEAMCKKSSFAEVEATFSNSKLALEYVRTHPVDLVMSDIEMPGMNGTKFAACLREEQPELVIVFTTCCAVEYIEDVESLADFFMMKPYTVERVCTVLERAHFLSGRQKKRLNISMIGPFVVELNGKVVKATNAKARELLALCLDHKGGIVSREEAVDKLWPDREFDVNAKKLVNKAENYIKKYFADYHMDNFFFTTHAGCYVNIEEIECDYYEYLKTHKTGKIPEGYLEEFEWAHEVLY